VIRFGVNEMDYTNSVILILSLVSFVIVLVILIKLSGLQRKVNELSFQLRQSGKTDKYKPPSYQPAPKRPERPMPEVHPLTGKVEPPPAASAPRPEAPAALSQKPEAPADKKWEEKVAAFAARSSDKVKEAQASSGVYGKMRDKVDSEIGTVKEAFEQRIGTLWVLIAGIITTLVATGFFLRYAYDNNLIGPWGRVMIIVGFGLAALGLGEWTRRRDFGVVARGLTAMGFAIMYAAVFSASSYYKLIGTTTALSVSILVTIFAMLYAVGVNEVLAALIALVGGYLSPIIISTGENRPQALFGYVSILSIGAMSCAIFRKWRTVNILAFVGTFGLYTGWFEKFYRPAARATMDTMPEQLPVALAWLGVFFVIFLIMPILYELMKKVNAKKEDVVLVVVNAAVVFYYLSSILYVHYRWALALGSLAACVFHLVLKYVVTARSRQDVPLRLSLLVISMFFVTVAIPMYLKMYAVALAWAGEGAILTVIGIKYRNVWIRGVALAALVLSIGRLMHDLPLHVGVFTFILNPLFGSWCLVAAGCYLCYVLYRRTTSLPKIEVSVITQILFGMSWGVLLAAFLMEWFYHARLNLMPTSRYPYAYYIYQGYIVILTVFMLLLLARPISPAGKIWRVGATGLGVLIAIVTLINYGQFFQGRHAIFANSGFAVGLTCIAGLFAAAVLFRRQDPHDEECRQIAFGFVIAGIGCLWIVLTEEIFFYWEHLGRATEDIQRCAFLGQMYISVMWAIYGGLLMALGFWKKSRVFRFISLGLFLLIIGKVFIFDMRNISSVYRIAGFGVLGVTLIGISYLYQYGKKKGMFLEDRPEPGKGETAKCNV